MTDSVASPRQAELAANLARVQERVVAACRAAGRDPAHVTITVVTKTWPATDVRILAGLGVRDVGENRDQEAAPKVAECAAWDLDLRWHFVGRLQRNKAASVTRYADVIESVDRVPLVQALDRGAVRHGRRITVLVQVSLDADGHRGGAAPDDVLGVCAAVEASDQLQLAGLMAVAPLGEDPAAAFARLTAVHQRVQQEFPAAQWLSAGMSGDLEQAVAAGATHVRVGSAVLGVRHNVR